MVYSARRIFFFADGAHHKQLFEARPIEIYVDAITKILRSKAEIILAQVYYFFLKPWQSWAAGLFSPAVFAKAINDIRDFFIGISVGKHESSHVTGPTPIAIEF